MQGHALGLVTPYDVHATILHLAGFATPPEPPSFGVSLLGHIARPRTCEGAGVPAANCLWLGSDEQSNVANLRKLNTPKQCEPMPLPPSVSSYYADMPVENRGRASLINCDTGDDRERDRKSANRVSEVVQFQEASGSLGSGSSYVGQH